MSPATGSGGCGSGACGCRTALPETAVAAAPAINGVALHAPGETLDADALRERAWGELLRQEAVRRGLLADRPAVIAPVLGPPEERVLQDMLDEAVPRRQPDEEECRRYYEAHRQAYVQGRQVHARHILFAVTPGVDVHALAVRAEQALMELLRKETPPGRFAELAAELSNCPSGANGGDLGWFGPHECADELANELFEQREPRHGMGLHPRLVHSRYGLHIVEVLGRKQGKAASFDEVRERIAMELAQRSRATALHQYIRLLAGQARVEGIDLEGASTPLVQ